VKRGFVKVYLAVDVKRGNLLSMRMTKEEAHYGSMPVPLVEEASSRVNVTGVIANEAYWKETFRVSRRERKRARD
jgi:hypothetical protein